MQNCTCNFAAFMVVFTVMVVIAPSDVTGSPRPREHLAGAHGADEAQGSGSSAATTERQLSLVLYVNEQTGTGHIYRECEHLANMLALGRVREKSFPLYPGSRARLKFCSTCVAAFLVDTLGSESPMLSHPDSL